MMMACLEDDKEHVSQKLACLEIDKEHASQKLACLTDDNLSGR